MSALKENMKKYYATKAIDIFTLILFGMCLYMALYYIPIQLVSAVVVVGIFVLFVWLQNFIAKKTDLWVVPKMDKKEINLYWLNDVTFWVVFFAVIGLLGKGMFDTMVYVIVAAVIIGAYAFRQWKKLNTEEKPVEEKPVEVKKDAV